MLAIDQIRVGKRLRQMRLERIAELAESIGKIGLLMSRASASSSGSERHLPVLMSPPRWLAQPRSSGGWPRPAAHQFGAHCSRPPRRSAISRSVRQPSRLTAPAPMPAPGPARSAYVDTSVAPLSMFR